MPDRVSHTDPADVRLIVLDVDGVLTDGDLIYDSEGRELKRFSVRDGFGITLWKQAGFGVSIITARGGAVVARRAAELGIEPVIERSPDKSGGMRAVAEATGVPLGSMAYMGDDWKDLPAMAVAGYPTAPLDAEPAVIERAAWVADRPGGRGAVRALVEHLLGARGVLDGLLAGYAGTDGSHGARAGRGAGYDRA